MKNNNMIIFLDKILLICGIGFVFSLYNTFVYEFEPWLLILMGGPMLPWAVSLCLHGKIYFWADPETKLDKVFLLFLLVYLQHVQSDYLLLYSYH